MFARTSLALCLALAAGCGGADYPEHDGYPANKRTPWRNPTAVALDARGEAEVDQTLSYARKTRARWFAVDLPTGGELDVELSIERPTERRFDVAFEVLDQAYTVLSKADREEDDAGADEKKRTLYELQPGRYYVHVYLHGRFDEADITIRLAFRSAEVAAPGVANVRFPGPLPEVGESDDAPAPAPRPKCVGKACKKKDDGPAPAPAMVGRISGITTSGGGTSIKIDRGSSDGVAVGWRGQITSKDGKSIPGGSFEVSRVSPRESHATVKASSDAVTAAKYVRLRAP